VTRERRQCDVLTQARPLTSAQHLRFPDASSRCLVAVLVTVVPRCWRQPSQPSGARCQGRLSAYSQETAKARSADGLGMLASKICGRIDCKWGWLGRLRCKSSQTDWLHAPIERNRRMGLIVCVGVQSPQVSLCVSFQPNLLFGARSQRLDPNHPKLCPVLPILNCDRAANCELATNRTQPHPGLANIESMDQV